MSDLTVAVELLRASRQALPEELREPWRPVGRWRVVGIPRGAGYTTVAECWEPDYEDDGRAVTGHIALTASPDVTEALADLLAAIQSDDGHRHWQRAVENTAEALAAAIVRKGAPS